MAFVNRRQFCAAVSAAALAPALGRPAAADEPLHCFVDESGKRGDWPLVVGVLATSAPEGHEFRIALLRRKYAYPRPLRYMSTDRNKLAFARALIDYYAASDLRFHGTVATERSVPAGDPDAAYAEIYRRALTALGTANLLVRTKYRPDSPRDRRLAEFLKADLGMPVQTGRRNRAPDNLTQLSGFLAGCVYGEITGVVHPLKRVLADHLRERIGATILASSMAAPRLAVTTLTA